MFPKYLANMDSSTIYGIVGIAITVLSSYFFYKLGIRFSRKNLQSIQFERKTRAKEALMALIESYIINGNILSYDVIQDRIKATERKEGIILLDELSPKELLQDVALRLDSTQYVSLEKKNNYSALIESMIQKIETNISIDQDIQNNFDNLKHYITNNDSEQALSLANQIMISTNEKIKETSIDKMRHYQFTSLGLFVWFWIYNGIIGFVPLISDTFLQQYHWYIFGFGIIVAITFQFSPFNLSKYAPQELFYWSASRTRTG